MSLKIATLAAILVAAVAPAAFAATAPLKVSLADPKWTGDKVPEGQWCQKFMGKGATPALKLEGLPAGVTSVVVAFNDETYQPMNNGGHGSVRFTVTPGATVELPSVPGETDALPAGVKTEVAHKASDYSGTGGAYLPPCSGGMGNTYSATVTAYGATPAALAQGKVIIGKY